MSFACLTWLIGACWHLICVITVVLIVILPWFQDILPEILNAYVCIMFEAFETLICKP